MKKSYNVFLGPSHPALEEPILFDFEIEGEKVVETRLKPGHCHRGIEHLGMRRNPLQVIHLAERVCGICSISHSSSFSRACEDAANIEVPERAHYIRTIISELERIHSHTLWAGLLAHEMGFSSVLHLGMNAREKVMDTLEYLTGSRVNYGIVHIGGVRRDIPKEKEVKLLDCAKYYQKAAQQFIDIFTHNKTIKMRTKGVGILTKKDALLQCAVGPTGRGSGIIKDVRQDYSYNAYRDIGFKAVDSSIIKKPIGDVLDRTIVRLLEVKQSADIIQQCVDQMPKGEINADKKPMMTLNKLKMTVGDGISRNEAPRGDLTHYVRFNESETVESWKVKAPTYNNLGTVPIMMKEMQIADIPVIVSSIDPCIACLDRVTVIKNGKEGIVRKDELRKASLMKTKRLEREYGKIKVKNNKK